MLLNMVVFMFPGEKVYKKVFDEVNFNLIEKVLQSHLIFSN